MTLQEIFTSLAKKINTDSQKINQLWEEIEANYTSNNRYYHTLKHLEHMFSWLEKVKDKIANYDALSWAVFYHDLYYDALKHDNEERSAERCVSILQELSSGYESILLVEEIILASKKHLQSDNEDINYFLDADLSVLGAPENTYSEYAKNIRKEYAVYPDDIYNPGRKKALQHFLEMPHIFKTAYFRNELEKTAKENLKWEIESL
jgi:predicted metal-dependent HD superfamily phosphohydrolase